jgi:hypothetical protein
MLVFLFINSMGMHLFMPLQDAIGMSRQSRIRLANAWDSIRACAPSFGLIAACWYFLASASAFFLYDANQMGLFARLLRLRMRCAGDARYDPPRPSKAHRAREDQAGSEKAVPLFLSAHCLNGVKKQIAYVYGTWVIVDILLKKADTIALLTIFISFASIFF